jgi:hypothetical protein
MFKKYAIPFDLDDPKATLAHRDLILQKPFLKRLYNDWYDVFIKKAKEIKTGKHLEIGSGGGFLKDVLSGQSLKLLPQLHLVQLSFLESLMKGPL